MQVTKVVYLDHLDKRCFQRYRVWSPVANLTQKSHRFSDRDLYALKAQTCVFWPTKSWEMLGNWVLLTTENPCFHLVNQFCAQQDLDCQDAESHSLHLLGAKCQAMQLRSMSTLVLVHESHSTSSTLPELIFTKHTPQSRWNKHGKKLRTKNTCFVFGNSLRFNYVFPIWFVKHDWVVSSWNRPTWPANWPVGDILRADGHLGAHKTLSQLITQLFFWWY